ncbi:MAG: radical SAM protein [Planctomycetes bacterium]|nr:radical SAM protein [Planctomycetota bacterium]
MSNPPSTGASSSAAAVPQDERLTLQWMNLEFASNCNLRCKWCSLDHDKPKQFMSQQLLAKVLDDVIADPGIELDRIELHNAGETLLHPDLPGMFGEIAARKERLPTINLLTNAGALNAARIATILDSGAIDVIRFSIDGGTKAEFEDLRRPAKWQLIRDNIHAFLDANERRERRLSTGVICIVDPQKQLSTDWMEPEFRELFARIDDVSLRYPHNWDGSEDLGIDDRDYEFHAELMKAQKKVCYFLVKDMVVLPNGDATVCCADLNGRGVIGNANFSSIRELYHSQKRQQMLRLFEQGRKDDIELCKDCTGYYE